MAENIAVLAPIPKARVISAGMANPGERRRLRRAWRKSWNHRFMSRRITDGFGRAPPPMPVWDTLLIKSRRHFDGFRRGGFFAPSDLMMRLPFPSDGNGTLA